MSLISRSRMRCTGLVDHRQRCEVFETCAGFPDGPLGVAAPKRRGGGDAQGKSHSLQARGARASRHPKVASTRELFAPWLLGWIEIMPQQSSNNLNYFRNVCRFKVCD